ncbi:hypothetical protein ACX3YC_13855 [Pseudomonas mohnii]|uniref:hypothetical protein n=1 Tax=Pseudomonas moraviensis TaxID=321662 RepID=UPI000F76EE01|nr:hypothetical protein [Pseudomonas moraviensis]RRW54369.1 hypothetical protein EGJ55_16175 [Pseudomonas moraviensis]
MNRDQMQQLIHQAATRGDDVTLNISAHVVVLLRALADDIENGKQQVGLAEMRLVQEHRPYSTYVVSVKDA